MTKHEKILDEILRGTSDTNISFDDLCKILQWLGFQERIRGSHHIFTKAQIEEILNLQPHENNKAKPYQVKQVRQVVLKHKLGKPQ